MAKSKTSSKALIQLFDRASTPVYLVNSENVITFANHACAQWVGLALESLVSSSCVFSSQDLNEVQNRIQGLCPPPSFLHPLTRDQETSRSIAISALNSENQKSWRAATICPFFDSDQTHLGVLIIASEEEFTNELLISGGDGGDADVDSEQLHHALSHIRSLSDQMYSLESPCGNSPFANRLRRQVESSISSNVDLLIIGPSGSGKEHLARTIHSARQRNHSSELLPVHCSIADQRLIQQNIKDIVGSRADSVSSNSEDTEQQDWLLLLDVDRLGEAAQNELLGFFQLPDFPLRTIATSSGSLIQMAEQQKYSADLAHHLSVMTIELVSLSKRQADIPILAQALIERDNSRRDRQLSGFSQEVMQQFIEFDWPENIDQLNRTIQAAARNARGPEISESELPDEFRHALRAMRIGTREETEIVLDEFLGSIEKELVTRALKQAKGNKTKAAKLLGISRPKLLRRLQFFSLELPDADPPEPGAGQLDASAFEELK